MQLKSNFALAAILLLLGGCAGQGPYEPRVQKPNLENTDLFLLLDSDLARSVTCTGIDKLTDAEARLRLIANIRNLRPQPMRVEVDCVFKDQNGFPTGEVVPFRVVYLPENGQEGIHFRARDEAARKFTIRVRRVRD